MLLKAVYQKYTGGAYQPEACLTVDEAVALLIIRHVYLEKQELRSLEVVLVDEIQDYTATQITLLQLLLPKASFTLVGDENQAIFNSTTDFNQIQSLFAQKNVNVRRYNLVNSYRSSASITRLFAPLAKDKEKMAIVPVRLEGEPPILFTYKTMSQFVSRLKVILETDKNRSLTILTKTTAEQLALTTVLLQEADISSDRLEIQTVTVAKGLEYSHVLLYNASEDNYHSPRDQRILYTAISRAMETLYISSCGEFTHFLTQ